MASWKDHPYHYRGHVFLLDPPPVFQAQVDAATAGYGTIGGVLWRLFVTNITLGSSVDAQNGMTLTLGSAPGGDDLGRARILGNGYHTTHGIYLMVYAPPGDRDGELTPTTGAYVTVWNDYRVWTRLPRIENDGTMKIDIWLTPGTSNQPSPPKANAGPGYAGFVDESTGVVSVDFDASGSFPVAPGASFVTGLTNRCTGGSASASSEYDAATTAPQAADGDPATYWRGVDGAGDWWWHYDLGSGNARAIQQLKLWARDASDPHDRRFPRNVALHGSNNNVDWDALGIGTNNLPDPGAGSCAVLHNANTTAYRYYRLTISSTHGQWTTSAPCIAQVELFDERPAYEWDLVDGTPAAGGDPTGVSLTASFPAGFRWVSLTVRDDNEETHTVRVPVLGARPGAVAYDWRHAAFAADATTTPHAPRRAFDGDDATHWQSGTGAFPHWLAVTFPEDCQVGSYSVQCVDDDGAPRDWTLQAWDGSAFVTIDTQSAETGWSTGEVRSYTLDTPVTSTIVRLVVTAANGSVALAGGTPTADDTTSASYSPDKARDGNPATGWQVGPGAFPHWIQVAFSGDVSLSAYTIQCDDGSTANAPKDWELQYWNGSAFVTADTQSGETGWTAGEVRSYTLGTPVTASIVRLVVTAVNGSYFLFIAEWALRAPAVQLAGLDLTPPANTGTFRAQVSEQVLSVEGQRLTLELLDDVPVDDIPEGTLVMVWEDEVYDGVPGSLEGPDGREHVKFIGWLDTEPVRIDAADHDTQRRTTLHAVDVGGRLAQLPGFTTILERRASPDGDDWSHMSGVNIDRFVWYVLKWFTTALELADFTWSGTLDTYAFPLLAAQGGTPYVQADGRAQTIAHRLTCDKWGRLWVKPDPQLQASTDRTATVRQALDADDWVRLRYTARRPSRYHWLWGSAVLASTDDASTPDLSIDTVYCVAPGLAPGQGAALLEQGEQVVVDQDELNTREGHRYAVRLNPRQTYFEVELAHGGDGGIDPAAMEWITLTIPPAQAAQRGLAFTAARMLPFEVRITHDHAAQTKRVTLRLEREGTGHPAQTYTPPS